MGEPDFMKQFVHSDFMDQIIAHRLKTTIELTIRDIESYEGRTTLRQFQREDLDMWKKDVYCMIHVYRYYVGETEFTKEVDVFLEERKISSDE